MRRPCLDCGRLCQPNRGRCPDCYLDRYGGLSHAQAHARARAHLATTLPAPCGRCGVEVETTDQWDADQRADGWQVAHSSCNRSAGASGWG